ncbi:hypothetical protein WJX77_002960 [Trebouxia sp. C0004]
MTQPPPQIRNPPEGSTQLNVTGTLKQSDKWLKVTPGSGIAPRIVHTRRLADAILYNHLASKSRTLLLARSIAGSAAVTKHSRKSR